MFDNINVFGDAFIHQVLVPYLGDFDDRDLKPLRRQTSPTKAADVVGTNVADAVATKAADAVSPDHGLWHEITGAPFLAKILKAIHGPVELSRISGPSPVALRHHRHTYRLPQAARRDRGRTRPPSLARRRLVLS